MRIAFLAFYRRFLLAGMVTCWWVVSAHAYGPYEGNTALSSGRNEMQKEFSEPRTGRSVGHVDLAALPQTIGIEHQDRVRRFARLSKMMGVKAPKIDQLQLKAGQIPGIDFPVPIVRVIFDEKVFFDFNEDRLRPEATPILDLMAENMRRDVPDAQLLVLGHTDAVGSDEYNIDLSRRRAMNVISSLIDRGVDPAQLSAVAIGESQPIAPNNSEEGRARNRRVEFMLSAERAANLQLVHKRRIPEEYLKLDDADKSSARSSAEVIVPASVTNEKVSFAKVDKVELQKPTPLNVKLRKPEEYQRRGLDDEFTF